MKIYMIAGKARSGKDTTGNMILDLYKEKGLKAIDLEFSYYIKHYAKKITGWDGADETKPRAFLQELGTDLIRHQIDEKFFIHRMIQDLSVYQHFFDCVTISDVRFIDEIEDIRACFQDVVVIGIHRDIDNGMSDKEKMHATETGLDGYDHYDYVISNTGTLEDLKNKVAEIVI